jgi:hypothetical protein
MTAVTNSASLRSASAWLVRRCSPIVDEVSVEMLRAHAEPAPWAGNTPGLVRQRQQYVVQRM